VKEFVPRPYQEAGIDLVLRSMPMQHRGSRAMEGSGLLLEPGSGKTIVALTAADILMNDRWAVNKTLVVAPKMVVQEVWAEEAAKWKHTAHLKMSLLDASVFEYYRKVTTSAVRGAEVREIVENEMSADDRDFLFLADVAISRSEMLPRDWRKTKDRILRDKAQIHLISRDHFFALVKLLGADWPYDLILGDESTMFKNTDSDRSRAMRYLRHDLQVPRLCLMSGTPSPRGLENLFAQVRLLDGGRRLGDKITAFRKTFMVPGARNDKRIFDWKARPGATTEVAARIGDICLAVRADLWRVTEPPRVVERLVSLPGAVLEQYRALADSFHLAIEGASVSAPQAAVLGNKLIQMASGAVFDDERHVHVVHDAKLEALDDLIEELDGEPLVIVYWFRPTLSRLRKRYGARLATTETKGFKTKFARGEISLLAIQPGAAGHGLDGLQEGGHQLVVLDLFHDWEAYQQVVSRLDRSGQQRQVTVHQILARGTKDLAVARVLADKGANQEVVLDALKWRA